MAEHRIRKNNIIYIIPDDELFKKWKNDEAFIDDYGRLMNRKPHRVLKELKHYVENTPMVQQRPAASPTAPVRKSSPVMDHLKETVRDRAIEASEDFIDYAVDKFFYEVLPNVWHEHIVPFYHRTKAALSAKELKADAVLAQSKVSADVAVKQPITGTKMTQEDSRSSASMSMKLTTSSVQTLKSRLDRVEQARRASVILSICLRRTHPSWLAITTQVRRMSKISFCRKLFMPTVCVNPSGTAS